MIGQWAAHEGRSREVEWMARRQSRARDHWNGQEGRPMGHGRWPEARGLLVCVLPLCDHVVVFACDLAVETNLNAILVISGQAPLCDSALFVCCFTS